MASDPTNRAPYGSPRRRPATFARQLALALELPFILVGGVVIGGVLGYLLDNWMGTKPLWTLLLGALGFAGGFRELLRRIPKVDATDDQE